MTRCLFRKDRDMSLKKLNWKPPNSWLTRYRQLGNSSMGFNRRWRRRSTGSATLLKVLRTLSTTRLKKSLNERKWGWESRILDLTFCLLTEAPTLKSWWLWKLIKSILRKSTKSRVTSATLTTCSKSSSLWASSSSTSLFCSSSL